MHSAATVWRWHLWALMGDLQAGVQSWPTVGIQEAKASVGGAWGSGYPLLPAVRGSGEVTAPRRPGPAVECSRVRPCAAEGPCA